MAIFHKHRHSGLWLPRSQPPDRVEIDWSHPLTRGLVFCVVANPAGGFTDLVRGPSRAITTRPTWSTGIPGSRAATYVVSNATTSDLAFTSGEWAVGAFGNLASASGVNGQNPVIFGRYAYASEASNSGWALTALGNGFWGGFSFANNGFGSYIVSGSGTSTGDVFMGMSSSASLRRLYTNGAPDGSIAANMNPAASTGDLKDEVSGAGSFAGSYLLLAWSRDVTDSEWAWLYREPFAFLRPTRPALRRYASVTTASGSAEIDGAGGASVSAVLRAAASATINGSGAVWSAVTLPASATIAGSGTATAALVTAQLVARATLPGQGLLTYFNPAANPFSSDFSSDFGGGTAVIPAVPATISGSGSLTVSPAVNRGAAASLAGSATFSPAAVAVFAARGSAFGDGLVSADTAVIPPSGADTIIRGDATVSASAVALLPAVAAIGGAAGLSVSGRRLTFAQATISGVASFTGLIIPQPTSASIFGSGTLTAQARLAAAGRATLVGVGTMNPAMRLRASGRATLLGIGGVAAFATSSGLNPAASGSIHLTGLRLFLPTESPLSLAIETGRVALDASDLQRVIIVAEASPLIIEADGGPLLVPLDDGPYPMSLLHPVSVDPAERIFLKIDASTLLSPSSETITAATFTPSSQATLDSHTLVSSYYDAPTKALGFQPTGGITGTQYAWTMSFNTTDVDSRTQTRKRTILVSVVSK